MTWLETLCETHGGRGTAVIPAEPLELNLDQVREAKEPWLRRRCLWVAGFFFVFFSSLTFGFLIIWFLLTFLIHRILYARFRGDCLRVGPAQYPEVHGAAQSVAKRLSAPAPTIFVTCRPGGQDVFSVNLAGEVVVVIHANLVAMLRDDEMGYLLAHELGHSLAGHLKIMSMLNLIKNTSPLVRILMSPVEIFRYFMSPWARKADITADRIAFEATGRDLDLVARTLAKLAAGEELAHRTNARAFAEQAEELRYDRWLLLNELVRDRPLLARRVKLVAEYASAEG